MYFKLILVYLFTRVYLIEVLKSHDSAWLLYNSPGILDFTGPYTLSVADINPLYSHLSWHGYIIVFTFITQRIILINIAISHYTQFRTCSKAFQEEMELLPSKERSCPLWGPWCFCYLALQFFLMKIQ